MKGLAMSLSVALVAMTILSGTAVGQDPVEPPAAQTSSAAAKSSAEHDSPRFRIPFEDFTRLYQGRQVLVLDVRDDASYRAGHMPGAVSMPLATLEQRVNELRSERRTIVTYCT
jgi:3-mercaptopyruvate sulfurtransferase SseA